MIDGVLKIDAVCEYSEDNTFETYDCPFDICGASISNYSGNRDIMEVIKHKDCCPYLISQDLNTSKGDANFRHLTSGKGFESLETIGEYANE